MSDKLKDLRNTVEIEVPGELDQVIHQAIGRGRRDMKKRNSIFRSLKAAACTALLFVAALTAGVNTVPAFAGALKEIEGLSGIVSILQFDRNRAAGGEVTDGQDIGSIDWEKTPEKEETVIISLFAEGSAAAVPGYFEVVKEHYPQRLVLHFNGVRSISAADIAVPGESGLIEDLYRLVTLDDSSQSLALSFKKPVEYAVAEIKDPAGIMITIKETEPGDSLPVVYSLRSASFAFGETVGVIESMLKWEFDGKGVRMLQDQKGTLFVEEGLYDSEAEALARKEALKEELDFALFVERVGDFDLRGFIGQ